MTSKRANPFFSLLTFVLSSLPVITGGLFLGGCRATGDGQGNDNGTGSTFDDSVEVVSFASNVAVSQLETAPSVIYTVTDDVPTTGTVITGYVVQVADNSPGAQPLPGVEPIEIRTNLPPGTMRSFDLCMPDENDPTTCSLRNIPVGFYLARLVVELDDGTEIVDDSGGIIQIQGPPNPIFIQPTVDEDGIVEVQQGATVLITFDAGDPEGDVDWRLFYLTAADSRNDSADQLGTQLTTGSGNYGSFALVTSALPAGDYTLGLSATDSGSSIASTVSNGQADRIVTIPNDEVDTPLIRVTEERVPMPPTIAFTAPGAADVAIFRDETYTLQFMATANEPGGNGRIDLVADNDTNFGNGWPVTIAADLPIGTTSYPLPTDLPEGTYRIGGQVRDGINPPVVLYATGSVTVVRTVTLVVTAPNSSLPLAPSTPGGTQNVTAVEWQTNFPASAGTVDVFARSVGATGTPIGQEIVVLAPTTPTVDSANFSSTTSGLFQISVRLTRDDGTVERIQTAPTLVRVSSLPPIIWVGSFADEDSGVDGAIFGGVNYEDNAGTSFTAVGDINGDSAGDFVINARYGKPFFTNPTGIGPGEAYLVFGSSTQHSGEMNLNSLGLTDFRGVTFAGIRTPQDSNETDGLTTVNAMPDVDGDARPELMFSFPRADSRGHNVDYRQDGATFPDNFFCTLENRRQFMRGGVVIVSSQNSLIRTPVTTGDSAINLDVVGQDFQFIGIEPEPVQDADDDQELTYEKLDLRGLEEEDEGVLVCMGSCEEPTSDEFLDGVVNMNFGFNPVLADDFLTRFAGWNGRNCVAGVWAFVCGGTYCGPTVGLPEPATPLLSDLPGFSGFYNTTIPDPDSEDQDSRIPNNPVEPFGARIIGIGMDDGFGTSVSLVRSTTGTNKVIVSAPNRTARGILFGPSLADPENGGEVDGLEGSGGTPTERNESGVAYMFDLRSLWTADSLGRIPPKPHQYMIGQPSHYDPNFVRIPNIDAIRIAGQAQERITNIQGIDDFNADGRNDFAVGSPEANSGEGRVYVAFRRQPAIEGDYVLEKLANSPDNPDRLDGVMIVTENVSELGATLASGVDFNGDGRSDLVIGAPAANNGVGEVIVVFGDANLISPIDGITVDTLLNTRNAQGRPRAARITGNTMDANGRFGFNVANAGDVDGDGKNDLMIAAPNGSPRFDSTPTDTTDSLTDLGVDTDFNGIKDDVSGPNGAPDGIVDTFDNLLQSGLVYVIYGHTRLDQIPTANLTINITQLGGNRLRGFIVVGRRANDHLGGGDAGDTTVGGIVAKMDRGRSYGLAGAGDVDGDGKDDLLIGSVLADPRIDAATGVGVQNGGEAYLVYGSSLP